MVLAKTPYTLKTTTRTKGIAIALTFFALVSPSQCQLGTLNILPLFAL
jgi:hypothetical protein